MSGRDLLSMIACGLGVVALAGVPFLFGDYGLSMAINIMSYTVLATAWSLFSGPTRYVSLATVAFFGIGAYTTAVFAETLPWCAVLAIATGLGIVVAAIVGLATLRLSGVYFVIFSLGSPNWSVSSSPGGRSTRPARSAATSSPTSPRPRSTGSSSRSPCWSSRRVS